MNKKKLLIHQIPQIEAQGSANIPAAILCEGMDRVLIGSSALMADSSCRERNLVEFRAPGEGKHHCRHTRRGRLNSPP
jgi:hypothetical protein